jgi:hypothetical protein
VKPVKLPAFTLGMDLLSDETSLLKGTVRTADNVEFDRGGGVRTRAGTTLVQSGEFHSLFTAPQRREMFGVRVNQIVSIAVPTGTPTTLYDMPSTDPVEWCEHNGAVFFSSSKRAGWIPAGSDEARQLGVAIPQAPTVAAIATGGLLAGSYMVAISQVDDRGEESGMCPWIQVELETAGGVLFSNLPSTSGWYVRIYCTQRDGDVMHLAAEFPAGLSQYLVGAFTPRTTATHDMIRPMPPGEFCRAWGARLYTAQGDTLYYSLPFQYGRNNRVNGYTQFNGDITFVEPVSGGVFVGAGSRVWFMGGEPSNAKMVVVSTCAAVPHSSTLVAGEQLTEKKIGTSDPVALWLSTSGYTVGTPDGRVVELQPERIRVAGGIEFGKTAFVLRDGVKEVITTLSSTTEAYGTAEDSVLPNVVRPNPLGPSDIGSADLT